MKNICTILLAIVLMFGMGSCKKYLDAKPDMKLAVPDNLVALQALLDNGIYISQVSPSLGEASADDYFMPQSVYDSRPLIVRQTYTWNIKGVADYNFANVGDWAKLYYIVYCSNLCISTLEKITVNSQNQSAWNNVKGLAYFYRGRSFLQLAWIFSKAYNSATAHNDLGIPLRLGDDFNAPSVRSNVQETYAQILSDFKSAIFYLPDNVDNPLRPSKAAVYGYLARTYLSMRNYDSAGYYAEKSLSLKNDLMDFNNASEVTLNAAFPFKRFNHEVVHEFHNNSFSISSIMQRFARVDSLLYKSYEDNDLRKFAFFTSGTGGMQYKGSYMGDISLFTGITTAEMYLILAECFARKNDITHSLNNLNTLLNNRWKTGTFQPYKQLTKEALLEVILKERRKELLFRDLRWIDIKRLNLEGANLSIARIIDGNTYVLHPNDPRFAIALPTDIIDLTGMPQNE